MNYFLPLRFNRLPAAWLAGVGLLLALGGCAPSQDNPSPATGALDASTYLAVGDGYLAGFSDGGLTRAGQENSVANLIALQLQRAGGATNFSQPLLEAGTGTGYRELVSFDADGYPISRRVAAQAVRRTLPFTVSCSGADTLRLYSRATSTAALPLNLAVPGLRLTQVETIGYGSETLLPAQAATVNPYFERLLPANDTRTYLQAATTAANSASFFVFFAGLDEFLPFVRNGGICLPRNNTPAILPTLNAKTVLLLNRLRAGNRPGIIATIPPLNYLPLLSLGAAEPLQARLRAAAGDTASLYIIDSAFQDARLVADNDYVLATALPRVGRPGRVVVNGQPLTLPYGRDPRYPLSNADVIDYKEYNTLRVTVTSYNDQLIALARTYNLPVGLNSKQVLSMEDAVFSRVAKRIAQDGVVYSAEPVRGNFFSLDYTSLTPRGNALVANAFIAAINTAYRANIPAVEVNNVPTVAH